MTNNQSHGATKIIEVTELVPGMQVLTIVEQTGNVKLKHTGFVSDQQSINSLQRLGVKRIEISLNSDSKQSTTTPMKLLLQHDKRQQMQFLDESSRGHNLFIPNSGNHRKWIAMQAQRYSILALLFLVSTLFGWIIATDKYSLQKLTAGWFLPAVSNTSTPSAQLQSAPLVESNNSPSDLTNSESSDVDSPYSEDQIIAQDSSSETTESANKDNDRVVPAIDEEPLLMVGAPPSVPLTQQQIQRPMEQDRQPEMGQQGSTRLNPELLRQVESVANELSRDTRSATEDRNQSDNNLDSVRQVPNEQDDGLALEMDEVKRTERVQVTEYRRLDELPAAVLTRLPALVFDAHMYSTIAGDRWVKVNQTVAREGGMIAPGVTLLEIEPDQVVLSFEQYRFAMPALSEW